jgi:tyrosine-protein kinase Etk/Wzc
MEETRFNLWRLLEIIALRIKFIILFVFFVTLISIVISLFLPRWYQATALLLPPRESGFNPGWSGNDDSYSVTSGLRLPIMATPSDIYARILESRQLAERVIAVNDLHKYYGIDSIGEAVKIAARRSSFNVTPEGLLEISYIDKDAAMASKIANAYADELAKMTRELSSSRARVTREFIAGRLVAVAHDLDSARNAMREFQDQYKAIDLDKQTELAIESAVGLKVNLANSEIELNVKEQTLSDTHPDVIGLRRRINEIKKQIRALEFGGSDSTYLNLPISEIPALKVRYAEIIGRLKVSETLYKILSEQYEQAKIAEKAVTPTVSILDRAYPPDLAIKPQKRKIVIFTFVISLIFALFLILILNYLKNLKNNSPEDYARFRLFYKALFGWLPGVKRAGTYK